MAMAACTKSTPQTGAVSTPQTGTIPECGRVDGDGLIAFVGEKVEVTEVPPEPITDSSSGGSLVIIMDQHYRARYQVLEKLCGDFSGDVIEFDAYDHYGFPYFARYETVLLFVSRYGDHYVHQKYQFHDVYKTRSGEWVGCGDPNLGERPGRRVDFRPVPLEFDEPPVFSVAALTEVKITQIYPPEYYSRDGDRVTCKAGAPVEFLYTIKRNGVLKAREELRYRAGPE